MRKPILATSFVVMIAATLMLALGTYSAGQPGIVWSIETRADGHIRLSAVNNSGSPITALAAVGRRTLIARPVTDTSVRFFDSVLKPFGPRQIPPQGTYTFTFFGPNPPPDQITRDVELKAAIFADGSSWGDPEWVSTLLLRRSAALKYNREALQTIQAAASDGSTRDDLTRKLRQLQDYERKAAKTTAERQMADFRFSEALLALRDTMRADGENVSLPESIARARSRLLPQINQLEASKPVPQH